MGEMSVTQLNFNESWRTDRTEISEDGPLPGPDVGPVVLGLLVAWLGMSGCLLLLTWLTRGRKPRLHENEEEPTVPE